MLTYMLKPKRKENINPRHLLTAELPGSLFHTEQASSGLSLWTSENEPLATQPLGPHGRSFGHLPSSELTPASRPFSLTPAGNEIKGETTAAQAPCMKNAQTPGESWGTQGHRRVLLATSDLCLQKSGKLATCASPYALAVFMWSLPGRPPSAEDRAVS